MIAWGAKVSPEFRARVVEMCVRLGIPPSWLMACIAFESGRTFSPSVRNKQSGATGLIQFMPSTAEYLGTTTDALATLSAEEQLDWVEKYFQPYAGRLKTISDCYMAILYPKAIGKPEDYPLFSSGEAYAQNKGLDIDPDGMGPLQPDHVVTKDEAAAFVRKALIEGMKPENVYEETEQPTEQTEDAMSPFLIPVITELGKIAPDIIRIVGKGSNVERNAQVAEKIIEAAKTVTEAASGEEAVTVLHNEPAKQAEFRNAVATSSNEWLGMVTRMAELSEKSVGAARVFSASHPRREVVGRFSFIEFLSLIFVLISATGGTSIVIWGGLSEEMKGAIVTMILIGGFTAVAQFWFGSSLGSLTKNPPTKE